MHVTRLSVGHQKLAYVIVADRKIKYPKGRSKVVYIGTTRNGVSRMASSAAAKAEVILSGYGIREFRVRVVTCRPRQNVRTWHKLERALILAFREVYGDVPKFNTQGKRMKTDGEFDLFAKSRLKTVLEDLA